VLGGVEFAPAEIESAVEATPGVQPGSAVAVALTAAVALIAAVLPAIRRRFA